MIKGSMRLIFKSFQIICGILNRIIIFIVSIVAFQSTDTLTYERLLFDGLYCFGIKFGEITHQKNTSFEIIHSWSAFFITSHHHKLEEIWHEWSNLLIYLCLSVQTMENTHQCLYYCVLQLLWVCKISLCHLNGSATA